MAKADNKSSKRASGAPSESAKDPATPPPSKVKEGRQKRTDPKATAVVPPPPGKPSKQPTFIVGIGASAGGLETYEIFFKKMPVDSGMAFILVTHLAPTYHSMLPDLLQKSTKMLAVEAIEGTMVEANCIYIIPPDRDLGLMNGMMQTFEQPKMPTPRTPINYFFKSLGIDQRERAIAIVLSGMGSDGSLGIKVVKEQLGLVISQDPGTAKFDGMPKSAIQTGFVDYILPPEEMPEKLLQYALHGKKPEGGALQGKVTESLTKIFYLIRSVTGHDLSSYKRSTILRRLERRMNIHQLGSLTQYIRYLQSNRQEVEALFKEILINVTSFFRDRDPFRILETSVLPQVLENRANEESVRIWIPGCSSGEEAYSIAILIREYMEANRRNFKVQIFGTDIDEDAIAQARAGLYPAALLTDVSSERLTRFFEPTNGSMRVKRQIREMLIFAPQDVIKDPPFTKLDLLCCRNLMIYLDGELQKKLLPVFHYSLRPGGVLFLGSSESIGEFGNLFNVIDKKWRIFSKKFGDALDHPHLQIPLPLSLPLLPPDSKPLKEPTLAQQVERILLSSCAPPSVLINSKGDIHYIYGRTGQFLEPAPGAAKLNIIEMAREGLRQALPTGIRRAVMKRREVVCENLRIMNDGKELLFSARIRPIHDAPSLDGMLLVLLEEAPPAPPVEARPPKMGAKNRTVQRINELEQELTASRENHQSTIEEFETSNEELKSMNEEFQSTNEELKSANEELETSREELQSLNEELTTVNGELQEKVERLSKTNRDIKDYLDSIEIPTIFLDNDLRITRFNAHARKIVNLIDGDIARPLAHTVSNLNGNEIIVDAAAVQQSTRPREREVTTKDNKRFLMRVLPYRTSDNVIEGVVITFLDLDELHRLIGSADGVTPKPAPVNKKKLSQNV